MPDFDIDAALTFQNPLLDAGVRLVANQASYSVYVSYKGYYHYIGSLETISEAEDVYEVVSPFEVRSHDLSMDEGIHHLLGQAGEFLSEHPEAFLRGRKSHLVNAISYRPNARI